MQLLDFRSWASHPPRPKTRVVPPATLLDALSSAAHRLLYTHLTTAQLIMPEQPVALLTENVCRMSLPDALCELGRITAALAASPTVLVQVGQPLLQDLVLALQQDPYKQMHAESALRSVRRESDPGRKADLLCQTFRQLAA